MATKNKKNYTALVGVCFGSSYADTRQSVTVNVSTGSKTARGLKTCILKAARKQYPHIASLFTASDTAICLFNCACDVPYFYATLPKSVSVFDGKDVTELMPSDVIKF